MTAYVFLDNTVLCNFAAVHRLDLLESMLRGRGRWSEAVAYEAGQSAAHLPDLDVSSMRAWLQDPIEIEDEEGQIRVEVLRRAVFGGTDASPLQHLGEAQTCYLIKESAAWVGSAWASDDHDALEFARRQGILCRTTLTLLDEGVASADLTASQMKSLVDAMGDADRHLA